MWFDRSASGGHARGRARPAQTRIFLAPKAGLVENDNMAKPNPEGAQLFDNIYPQGDSGRLRRGSNKHATIDDSNATTVEHLASYEFGSTSKMFACTGTEIFDVTSPADPDVAETPVVISQTSGEYANTQFSTTGSHYLVMVNGTDNMLQFDGTYWASISADEVFRMEYDVETGAFAQGLVVTGGTSGATATIQRVVDDGATGTLLITGITGTFQDNETITDSGTGSATSNIPSGVTSVAPAITGVDTADLSHVWQHKTRIWAVEKGTLSAWYLAVDSRTGVAAEFPLNGIFKHGGQLIFGATWSLDAGSGLDDMQVFATNQGELAVYQGTDPTSAIKWSLVGVYQLGRPMGKNAWFTAGGDLAIITDDGIVPVSAAIRQDRAALQEKAVSHPIEDSWRQFVKLYDGSPRAFEAVLWPKEAMLLVTMPDFDGEEPFTYIANSRTGAWARYTNWDARCYALLGDRCFFGTQSGTVIEAEVTGSDDGQPYVGKWVPKFDDGGNPQLKCALHARVLVRTDRDFIPELFAIADYSSDYPAPGENTMTEVGDVWGSGLWGTAKWGTGSVTLTATSEWQAVAASGSYLVPGLYITSGIVASPTIEIVSMWLQFEQGNPI